MRAALLILPIAVLAAPAIAQTAPATPVPSRTTAAPETIQIPPELNDPTLSGRLVDMMKVLSGTFLNLPVGEAQAALEGRPATAADRRKTVRSETRLSQRQLNQQLEASKPMMQASMKALVSALPAMMKGMGEAQKELERASTNLPRPDYPKR